MEMMSYSTYEKQIEKLLAKLEEFGEEDQDS